MASITGFGGLDEIGGNRILAELDGTSIFLDFGKSFGAEGAFYEEFLQPRSTTKLHDLLRLDLLPALDGVYRRDALQPRGLDRLDDPRIEPLWASGLTSYEAAREAGSWTPEAVFVSHAHLDHAGYLPYLGNLPVVCSQTTETVLGAIADVSSFGGFDDELLELSRREVDEYGSRSYFPGEPTIRTADPIARDTVPTTDGDRTPVGSIEIETLAVGHSIPGSMAALIEGSDTQLVYTGDLRFHGRSGADLGDRLAGLRPDVMLCEGTRIDQDEPDDEEQVQRELTAVIDRADGLVMVGCAWKDLERYETIREAAHAADRIPVFDPRLAYLKARLGGSVYDEGAAAFVERSDSMLYSPGDYTRGKYKVGELPVDDWDNADGVVDTVHLEAGYTAADIRADPHRFVLQLDFYRLKHLVDLDPPPGSVYVRAQTEPFNEELEISERRLVNWLRHFGINDEWDGHPVQIHASGHASGPELQAMIEKIEPRILVPIHTEHPDRFENPHGDVIAPAYDQTIRV